MCSFIRVNIHNSLTVDFINSYFTGGMNNFMII